MGLLRRVASDAVAGAALAWSPPQHSIGLRPAPAAAVANGDRHRSCMAAELGKYWERLVGHMTFLSPVLMTG